MKVSNNRKMSFLTNALLLLLAITTFNAGIAAGADSKIAASPKIDSPRTATADNKKTDDSVLTKLFTEMDTDHDSKLSLPEFKSNFHLTKSSIKTTSSNEEDNFWNGFTSSTMMIIATEIGDKTFFIAAVLSMRNSRLYIFSGAVFALICMTILSTLMGLILPSLLPRSYTHVVAGVLFLYFGVKLISDSRGMEDKVSDELEEVEEELLTTRKKEDGADVEQGDGDNVAKSTDGKGDKGSSNESSAATKILIQAFVITFLAEWGDRSQIATIALAADKDPYGVTFGACFGHSLCTGMAVVGGRMLASKISEKTVSFWGGVIFLGFGVHSLFFDS